MHTNNELKSLRALQWVADVYPEGAPGHSKVFHDELVAFTLLKRKWVRLVFLPGECRVIPTPLGLEKLKESQPSIGNA